MSKIRSALKRFLIKTGYHDTIRSAYRYIKRLLVKTGLHSVASTRAAIIPIIKNVKNSGAIVSQASTLNDELFSNIRAVLSEEWSRFEKKLRDYCVARQFSDDYTQAWLYQHDRLYFSIQWLETLIDRQKPDLVGIDLGSESPATDLWCEYFPNVRWKNSTGDLRYAWDMESDSVDLLVCTEVVEHLSDIPEGVMDGFYGTGIRAMLKEAYRVLKPGGRFFITTPNGASIVHLEHLLKGDPPWFYKPHIREYTPDELIYLVDEAGFQILRCEAVHCFNIAGDYTRLFALLLAYNYKTDQRGDDIFLIAHKR